MSSVTRHSLKKYPFSLFVAVVLLLLLIVRFASDYLTYSDIPSESEAVVLFVGPGFENRQQEACRLITECRPKYLIVPAYNMVTSVNGSRISRIRPITEAEYSSFKVRKKMDYEAWYEDTHVEVMETKRLMEATGVRSAIFVSSPYHLRRIKLISDRLFEAERKKISYVASRNEAVALQPLHVSFTELHWQVSEYAKIAWYFLYHQFERAA
jgi:hypothetical protein